jgi:uncharacterized protein (DUF2225 family)
MMESSLDTNITCPVCTNTFHSILDLKAHVSQHSLQQLQQHNTYFSNLSTSLYLCPHCILPKLYSGRQGLSLHIHNQHRLISTSYQTNTTLIHNLFSGSNPYHDNWLASLIFLTNLPTIQQPPPF